MDTNDSDAEPETVELALPTQSGRSAGTEAKAAPAPGGGDEAEVTEELAIGTATGHAEEAAPTASGKETPAHRAPGGAFGRRWWIKAVIVGLCALLGLSLAAQLRQNQNSDGELASARQQDLVRILDELDSREQRLRSEINDLEARQRTLDTNTAGSQTVLTDLQQREQELGILAGTLPAEGTGIKLVFRGGRTALPAEVILDAVEELRGAGAEALQIGGAGGAPVRIVASTSFLDSNGDLLIGDRELTAPYTLLAIGEPQTMRAALAIPGGVVDSVRDAGGTVQISTPATVQVTATRQTATPKYATPVD
jgi:uncharacterized protein YlxW (UPF0749 family)